MREILFRGKRADNGKWVEGYVAEHTLIPEDLNAYVGLVIEGKPKKAYDNNFCYVVDPATVGQYTGLTDKNGKQIFEGDIVKNKLNIPNKRYVIKYDSLLGAFIGEDGSTMHFTTFDGDSELFEVIGNIHDNQELLKGAQE